MQTTIKAANLNLKMLEVTLKKGFKKTLLIFIVSLGALFAKQSYADFEAVETTLTQLEKVQKKAEVIQEKYKKIESAINSVRQGDFGPISDLAKEYKIDKIATKQFNKLAGKANPSELQEALEKETIPNYTNENQVDSYNKFEVDAKLANHANNKNNPHGVTPSQIGAAPAYTYGKTELTEGVSALETGKLYFVYE